MQKSKWMIAAILSIVTALSQSVYAEGPGYSGNSSNSSSGSQNPLTGMSNAAPGGSPGARVVPVSYGTNYETQYSPFASFMSSPYNSGGMNGATQYGTQSPAAANQVGGANVDPYAATEVSPYSKYSPYMEIVGEGSDYTLGIDDVVTIVVRNQPDFSGRYVIDPEGNIQYSFVGDIPAIGKTKEDLKQDIINRLKKFVRYPDVAVMISEYRSKSVFVFGYVNAPGKYAMKGDHITVKEAIIAAGLPRWDGATSRVYVIRPSEQSKDGKVEKKKINVHKLLNKGDSTQDFILQPGDTIVVNQRYYDKFVNNFTRLIGPMFQAAAVYELGWGSNEHGFFGSDKKD
ncbi:MAG: polysaccharide export protein [Candidatus Omnitrophica bacterium]|nr:polysaccharide export protein [Candidatus Omnitrophota bacterium]MDD5672064.1 polysaccharide export protein [Candidatus Omnitrophota bacterium]